MNLSDKHCKQYSGKEDILSVNQEQELLKNISGWTIDSNETVHKLQKTIKSETFMGSVNLLRDIALIAQSEQHHPDFHLSYTTLTLVLYTHKVNGLTENDFIMASKIDALLGKRI
jgi:4a-hydroxytetrahydrobiopterin dehydratase